MCSGGNVCIIVAVKADKLCTRFLMADVSGSSPLTSIPFVFFSSLPLFWEGGVSFLYEKYIL